MSRNLIITGAALFAAMVALALALIWKFNLPLVNALGIAVIVWAVLMMDAMGRTIRILEDGR